MTGRLFVLLGAWVFGAAVPPGLSGRTAAQPHPDRIACTVQVVNDGDTLRCADGRRVRLLQIDAPERDQQPSGPAARGALQRLAPVGTTVQLELDQRRLDQFGRTLAFVWLPDGRMANEVLARTGRVVVLTYAPNLKYGPRIQAAADSARREKLGVWAAGALPCEPRLHRKHLC